jgi:PGF-CTERM protein
LILSSPTVVNDPESGDSIGSRAMLGTLGHHGERADRVTTESTRQDAETEDDGSGDDSTDDGDESSSDDGSDSATDDSSDTESSGDGSGPGFGVGGALAGLGGAGYLLKRRFDDENRE